MAADDNELKVRIIADVNLLAGGMDQANSIISSAISQMNSAFSGLQNAISSIGKALPLIGTAIAGALSVEGFRSAITAALSYNESILQLSRTMGMSTESASVMSVALRMIGSSSEAYTSANLKLDRQVKTNEESLNQLGMATRAGNGALLSQEQLFKNAVATMGTYKEGADRNQFALYAFGRSANDVSNFLRLNDTVMKEAAAVAQQYGLVVGEQAALQTEKFQMNLNTLGIVLDAVKMQVGNQLLPELLKFTGWASGILPGVMTVAVGTVKGLISAFDFLRAGVQQACDFIMGTLSAMYSLLSGIVKAIIAVMKGDLNGAWEAIKEGGTEAAHDMGTAFTLMVDDSTKAYQNIKALWSKSPTEGAATEAPTPKGTKEFKAPEVESRLPKWEQELRQMQIDEDAFFNFSISREKEYWEQKLEMTSTGSERQRAERMAVQNKIFDVDKKAAKDAYDLDMEQLSAGIASENTGWNERLELMRSKVEETKRVFGTESPEYAKMLLEETKMEAEQTKERMKILSQWDAQTREINAKRLESDIKTNDEASKTASDYYQKRFSLGEINATELARVETQLANDRYATEQELLGKELTLWSSEPTKYQEVLNQIKAASQKNATDIQKIQEDLAKNNSQAWNSFLSPLTSAFDRTVKGIIQGTTTLQQGMKSLFQSILLSFTDMLVKTMVTDWMGAELKKLNISQMFANLRIALLGQEAAESSAIKDIEAADDLATEESVATATKAIRDDVASAQIQQDAAQAAAGAYEATVGIPYVGPILAPAAATVAYTAVMAYESIAGAEGGWDVDRTKLTVLHPQEMVLPAYLAGEIRSMVGQGGGRGGGVNHFHINAMDSSDVAKSLQSGGALNKAMRRTARNFGFKK